MVVLHIRGRFDLDQAPLLLWPALEYIDPNKHVAVLESGFEYGGDLSICDKFAGLAYGLFEVF